MTSVAAKENTPPTARGRIGGHKNGGKMASPGFQASRGRKAAFKACTPRINPSARGASKPKKNNERQAAHHSKKGKETLSSPASSPGEPYDSQDDDGDDDDDDESNSRTEDDDDDGDGDEASPNKQARSALRSVSKAVVEEAGALAGGNSGAGIQALVGMGSALQKSPETVRKFKAWCSAHNMDLEKSLRKVYSMFKGEDLRSASKAELASALGASLEMQSMAKRQQDLAAALRDAASPSPCQGKGAGALSPSATTNKTSGGSKTNAGNERSSRNDKAARDHAGPPLASNVAVVVRVRPLSGGSSLGAKTGKRNASRGRGRAATKKAAKGAQGRCCTVGSASSADDGDETNGLVAITKKGSSTAVLASQAHALKSFYAFDAAFGEQSSTRDIYERVFVRRR